MTTPYPAIDQLVPHRGAMILIDRVVAHGPVRLEAEATIRAEPYFPGAARVPAYLGLEYMAQAIAAYAALGRSDRAKPPGIGLLLGTRDFKSAVAAFEVGQRVGLTAELVLDGGELGVFDCAIRSDGRSVATARLNVFQPADPAAFMKSLGREADGA
jgi:predicted hotdog family 3-hydroxylacyl-ACP dehydratase